MIGNLQIQRNQLIMQTQINALASMGILQSFDPRQADQQTFVYTGNFMGLESKLQHLQIEAKPITQARIIVCGNQVKQANLLLLILTIILGTLSVIPFFCMFCNWWRKGVSAAYNIPMSTYKKLQVLILCPTLKNLTLTICDNTFNKAKTRLLYYLFSRSHLKNITLINIASAFDYEDDEWTQFKRHIRPIKNLNIVSDIRWFYKVVL